MTGDTRRKRHHRTLLLVGLCMGIVVGALGTAVIDRVYLTTTAAVIICVATLVSPPHREVYPGE